jgi:hypothetical protein
MIKTKNGGKVIASGGYGCIFRPAIKCKTKKNISGQITKLMTTKHAESEFKEIEQFKKILSHIPNYQEYFLLDGFSICEPEKLSSDDLQYYVKKCKALQKDDITIQNINQSLDKIMGINMPDGGIDVGDFIEQKKSSRKLVELNNSLILLLKNGIVPMNKLHVFHCDIKESNVLVKDNSKLLTRLIDWGLSTQYTSGPIPKPLTRRPFQYNIPFSIILFNKEFINRYKKHLKKNPNQDYYTIREFVINYIFVWIDIRGDGHLKLINKNMNRLFVNQLSVLKQNEKDNFIAYDFTYYYIIEYLSKILQKYTIQNKFHLNDYFNEVFIKNVDIWGFIMIYMPFVNHLYDNYNKLKPSEIKLFEELKYIIVHFLFETAITPIPVEDLLEELTKLNPLFQGSNISSSSKTSQSSSKTSQSSTKTNKHTSLNRTRKITTI